MLSDSIINRGDKGYMFPVGVSTPLAIRIEVCDELNMCIANMFDLSSHVKHAHWNVKGTSFIAIHKLLDEIYKGLIDYVDVLAERSLAMGGTVRGTLSMAASESILIGLPISAYKEIEMIILVNASVSLCSNILRDSIDKLDELGDKISSNIIQDMVGNMDKWGWFINSHLGG